MALHFGKKGEYDKKKVVGQLRRTQLVTTFGSGAIVDMPDYSVVIAATNYWKDDSPVLHEPNLEKLLKETKDYKSTFGWIQVSNHALLPGLWKADAILGVWR